MNLTSRNWKSIVLSLSSPFLICSIWMTPGFSQTQTEASAPSYTQVFPQTSELDLTLDQQAQLSEIAQNTQAQILSILTPDQQQQLQAALANGQTLQDTARTLGLSPVQRNQLQSTVKNSIPQIQAVLTPEQLSQLQNQRGGGLRRRGF